MSLVTAFAEIRKHNLFAYRNFMCCQTCGCSAIVQKNDALPTAKKRVGYAFYHRQDAEGLDRDGGVYIAYGTMDEGDDATDVGELICDIFKRHGCPVDWNGKSSERLLVWRDKEAAKRGAAAKKRGRFA